MTTTTTPSAVLRLPRSGEAVQWCYAPGVRGVDREHAGYWRSLLLPNYAAAVWAKVSAAVEAGKLGPAARLRPARSGRVIELRAFVVDADNKTEAARVRTALRQELNFQRGLGCYRFDGTLRWRDPGADVPLTIGRKVPAAKQAEPSTNERSTS